MTLASLSLWKNERVSLHAQLNFADLWVGLFWRRQAANFIRPYPTNPVVELIVSRYIYHFWLCLLPCLPLYLVVQGREFGRGQP
jgi:hypothetical protein